MQKQKEKHGMVMWSCDKQSIGIGVLEYRLIPVKVKIISNAIQIYKTYTVHQGADIIQ